MWCQWSQVGDLTSRSFSDISTLSENKTIGRLKKREIKSSIRNMMVCVMEKYPTASPVEAHALYDGQLIPARDWRLLLTGVCRKDSNQFKPRAVKPGYWLFARTLQCVCSYYLLRCPRCPAWWRDSSWLALHPAKMKHYICHWTTLPLHINC